MKLLSYKKMNSGYVLLMAMILLIMLTMLALALASLNTTQTRIASNQTDAEISLEKAEGALNEANNRLIKGTYTPSNFIQNSNGLYILDPDSASLWTRVNWSSGEVITSFQGSLGKPSSYIIEQLPPVVIPGQNMKTPAYIYRITARAEGASGDSAIILQSTVQIQ